jgi:deazaflavin-dependent oxidoreductase (nitroreductase family)
VYSTVLDVHQRIYEATDGLIGHKVLGVPTLLLRTTGRRSGQRRCNALVYADDGGSYVVVASNGGAERPPGWYFNVKADPSVEVQIGRRKMPASAKVVERGDPDYDRLWRLANDNNRDRFEGYQKRTERPIPLVVLTPS